MSVGLPAGALNQTWLDQFQAWKHALDLGAGANAPLPIGLRRKICSAFAQARSVRVGLGVAEVADRHVAARGQGIDVVGHDAVRATLTGAVVQRPTVGNRAIGLETNLVGVLRSGQEAMNRAGMTDTPVKGRGRDWHSLWTSLRRPGGSLHVSRRTQWRPRMGRPAP